MGLTLQEVTALKKLEGPSFQRFIEKLNVWEIREEYKTIPKDDLMGKDPEHVAGLINQYYKYAYGVEVTLAVLEEIGEKKVREELQRDLREVDTSGHGLGTSMYTDQVLFIENHRSDLIGRITDIDPVLCDLRDQDLLTEDQYKNVMGTRTSQEKMRKLCDIISNWEDTGKYTAYTVLRKYNEEIIRDLEKKGWVRRNVYSHFRGGIHFVDRHRSHLIHLKEVNPVIDDLHSNHLLTKEDYTHLQSITTPAEKMKYLYRIFLYHTMKDQFYISLWRYNYTDIKNLEKSENLVKSSSHKILKAGDHFIDRYKEDLIRRIKNVHPVIEDLYYNDVLVMDEFSYIMEAPTSENMMRRLYDIISDWDDYDKEAVYKNLYKYNPRVFNTMKMVDDSSKLEKTKHHIMDRHKENLIKIIKNVCPVINHLYHKDLLTREERMYIMKKTDPKSMMRRLYNVLKEWDDKDKDEVYKTLYKYNMWDIDNPKNLKVSSKLKKPGDHFIDRHIEDLIDGIKHVHPIMSDLWIENLLTREDYYYIMERSEPKNMMRCLYDMIREWNGNDKEKVYEILYRYNSSIIDDLKKLEVSSKLKEAGDHFIDRHKEDLIRRIDNVHPVIDDLYCNKLLTSQQYGNIIETSDTQGTMRHLYDIISEYDEDYKDKVYYILRKYNPRVIDDLEKLKDPPELPQSRDHFIDRHKEILIKRIEVVHPVIDDLYSKAVLTKKQYEYLKIMANTKEMMRCLFDFIRDWDVSDKEKVYNILYKYNPKIINDLKMVKDPSKLEENEDHFMVRHKRDLIKRINNVRPVIDDLCSKAMLTKRQYNCLKKMANTKTMMRRLYDFIEDRDDIDKEEVYQILYKYNSSVIEDLKILKDPSKLEKKISQTIVRPQVRCMKTTVDTFSCTLCGEDEDQEQEIAEVVSTIDGFFRLDLKSPGLYRCQKTGIKFRVNGPVIIEYKLDSWSDHMKGIPGDYEILGPLFNLKTLSEPNIVLAMYLPHYLCLKAFTGDKSLIKCAHFSDGNMTLETPTRIDPFYITLENPTFSFWGVLLSFVEKKTPIHGFVLIYFTILCRGDPDEEHRIHLYLLPHTTDMEETLYKMDKINDKSYRIRKPERTRNTVYTNVKYLVTGHPGASACPEDLEFQQEPYDYTEIRLKEKDVEIVLELSEENNKPVWKANLTLCDFRSITQSLSQLTIHEGEMLDLPSEMSGLTVQPGGNKEHFVDRHRKHLIDNITSVSPVLDDLKQFGLLNNEQYQIVYNKRITQDQMRELMRFVSTWDDEDKDKFFEALQKYNSTTIKRLKRM